MDPSLEFAQAVLDQLRHDLKRFGTERRQDIFRWVPRSDPRKYFREVKAENLRLTDAFGLMRGLGFTPAEYLANLQGSCTSIPPNASGFMRRHPLGTAGTSDLSPILVELLPWARGLAISEDPDEDDDLKVDLDLGHRLRSLGLPPPFGERLILRYTRYLFEICSDQRPTELPIGSIPGLIQSILLLVRSLAPERCNLGAMAQLIDIGFHFERFINDLALRGELFLSAAKVSGDLECLPDALWCSWQAMRLAVLAAEPELLGESREMTARLLKQVPPADDQARICKAMRIDRRFIYLSSQKLDLLAGGTRAFTNLTSGRRPLKISKWVKLDAFLSPPLTSCLIRAAATDGSTFPGSSGILPCLKVDPDHRATFQIQGPLSVWAKTVSIDNDAPSLKNVAACLSEPNQGPWFDQSLDYFGAMLSSAPEHLNVDDALAICRGFLNVTYHLKGCGHLDDAVDFIDMAFRLIDQLDDQAKIAAYAYRMAANLLIDLGQLNLSEIFAVRSSRLEMMLTQSSFGTEILLSLYVEGIVYLLKQRFSSAEQAFQSCRGIILASGPIFPLPVIEVALAKTKLKLGRPRQAVECLKRIESGGTPLAPEHQSDRLFVEAECLSALGFQREPMVLLDRAKGCLDIHLHGAELLVIELEQCKHLLRFGLLEQAAVAARSLLPKLGKHLHPMALLTCQEITNLAFESSGYLTLEYLDQAQQRVRFPNLR